MIVVAVDWSGAKARGGARDIALAEAVDGRLIDIRVGLSRADVERWLLGRAASTPQMVIGLDFAFSVPAWFAREKLGATSVDDVWAVVEAEGEQWLGGSAPWPFWGRGERLGSSGLYADRALRQTEREVAVLTGARPKSVFQLVGSGQVGPGSIRGMPILRRLRAQGFAIWPFDAFSTPLLVEIYPRVFTGKVVKSSSVARQHYLSSLGNVRPGVEAAAAASEHAFDAACSALAMASHVETMEELFAVESTPYDMEGKMFVAADFPALRRGAAQAPPEPPLITPLRTRVASLSRNTAAAHADTPSAKRPMVRVMRTSVTGLDDVPTDELHERIEKLERLLANPTQIQVRSAAERTLRACRRALEPDFAHTKVHHRSDCWFVDRYEEGRFAGGAKRKFVLVPADAVPDGVGGCQFCESGRLPAVKLQQAGAGGSTSSLGARRPLSRAGRETKVRRLSGLNYANAEAFIASIPDGYWTSFKDVATAAGNPDAAMAIGNWLRESGGSIHKYWRVLRSDGYIPDGFVSHAPGLPHDAVEARDLLRTEGIPFNHAGIASKTRRFPHEHWTGRGAASSRSARSEPPPSSTGIQIGTTVRIRDLDTGEHRTWTLVAKPDASPSEGKLSIGSPIGVALRGKKIGDTATATTPKGPRRYAIEHADLKG